MKSSILCALLAAVTLAGAAYAQVTHEKLGQKGAPTKAIQKPTLPEIKQNLGGAPIFSPAPQKVHSTLDLAECGKHGGIGGGIACQVLLARSELVLVWDWSGAEKIDGYRIFRTDGGKHDAVGVQQSGKDITLFVVPKDGAYTGKCYTVVAFAGSRQSLVSNEYCATGGATLKRAQLKPTQVKSMAEYQNQLTGRTLLPNAKHYEPADMLVGYDYHNVIPAPNGNKWMNPVYRTDLLFDLTDVMHKKIWSAFLKLHVSSTSMMTETFSQPSDHSTSCLSRIGFGIDRWWTFSGLNDGAVALTPGTQMGPDVSYDVKSMVASWAENARPNFGFVLKGDEKPVTLDETCLTQFHHTVTLEIEYSD